MNEMARNIRIDGLSVSVFGVGYAGCVSAACLANDGFRVIAVDTNPAAVEHLAAGRAPVHEPGLSDMTSLANSKSILSATGDAAAAVNDSDISICCVGTPSQPSGAIDTSFVEQVSREIGEALRHKDDFHVVAMRSTILPGTMDDLVVPTLEVASGKVAGRDFGVVYYPEFLREGSAISDYYNPGAIVLGQHGDDTRSVSTLSSLLARIPCTPQVIPMRSAEIVKYVNNFWHAAKVSFANEVGNLCKIRDIDSHEVMRVLCSDRRLNISDAYMKPGFAFGGSCLPKDLRSLRNFGRLNSVATPVLDGTCNANAVQIERAKTLIKQTGKTRVGFAGVTFKENTDDLRESPMMELAETFIGKGFEVHIFDPNLSRDPDGGRSYVEHLSSHIVDDFDALVSGSEVIVVGNRYPEAADAICSSSKSLDVIDLVRIAMPASHNVRYEGLCW